MTRKVLVLGAGKIGRKITDYLQSSGDYLITVADNSQAALDSLRRADCVPGPRVTTKLVRDEGEIMALVSGHEAVISALYWEVNPSVAQACLTYGASYFDLTEDVRSTEQITEMAYSYGVENMRPGQVIMPQCGLAPGIVSIVAGSLAERLHDIQSLHLRVGALPCYPEGRLKYNLTWSTDGLINEYLNPCNAIVDGEYVKVQPLEGVEHFSVEGVEYEAFNTSGGLGSLCETIGRHCQNVNYKTLRYPGHRDLMQFLLKECGFDRDRPGMKRLLERSLPQTDRDVVVIFCTATGFVAGQLTTLTWVRHIYGTPGDEDRNIPAWSAIQITTAASVCAVMDMHFSGQIGNQLTGLINQEEIDLGDFLRNRFGKAYCQ